MWSQSLCGGASVYVWSQSISVEPESMCGASVYVGSQSISVEPVSMWGAIVGKILSWRVKSGLRILIGGYGTKI